MVQLEILCPMCGGEILIDKDWENSQVQCPLCKKEFIVPELSSAKNKKRKSTAKLKFTILLGIVVSACVMLMFSFKKSAEQLYDHGVVSAAKKDFFQVLCTKKIELF